MWCWAPAKLNFISQLVHLWDLVWPGHGYSARTSEHQVSIHPSQDIWGHQEERSEITIIHLLGLSNCFMCSRKCRGHFRCMSSLLHWYLSGGNYFCSRPTYLLQSGKCLPKNNTLIKSNDLICPLLGKEHCPHYNTDGLLKAETPKSLNDMDMRDQGNPTLCYSCSEFLFPPVVTKNPIFQYVTQG